MGPPWSEDISFCATEAKSHATITQLTGPEPKKSLRKNEVIYLINDLTPENGLHEYPAHPLFPLDRNHRQEGYMSSPIVIDEHCYMHLRKQKGSRIDLKNGETKWIGSKSFGNY